MRLHGREVVAHDEVPGEFVSAVSQPSRSFDTHLGSVEVLLPPIPTSRQPVRNTGVFVKVEALLYFVVDDSRPRQAFKAVNNEDGLRCALLPVSRQFLRGKALSAAVDSRDLEVVLHAGGDVDIIRGQADDGPVVVARISHSSVHHIGCGVGRRFECVFRCLPFQSDGVLCSETEAEGMRGKRLYESRSSMPLINKSGDGLIE